MPIRVIMHKHTCKYEIFCSLFAVYIIYIKFTNNDAKNTIQISFIIYIFFSFTMTTHSLHLIKILQKKTAENVKHTHTKLV